MSAALEILYADDAVLAVAKPVGIASIPERSGDRFDLQSRAATQVGGRLWVVHRLDKEVSGVILYARTAAAHRFLNMEFEARRVQKTYRVVVWGVVADERGTMDAPLREFGSGRVAVDLERGKPSQTDYEVVVRGADRTEVLAYPATGRRHQLRAHFWHLGHPIVGDPRYGDKALQTGEPRLFLHAERIEFAHPTSGQRMAVTCPAPLEFRVSPAS